MSPPFASAGYQSFHRVTQKPPGDSQSQNDRTVDVGWALCMSPGPTPALKNSHLELVTQDPIQMAFEYLQGGRLHYLPGQPVPELDHSQS